MISPLQQFVETVRSRQNRDGSWSGVILDDGTFTAQDSTRHRIIYTSQVLRACAALGLNDYDFVADGVEFLDRTGDEDPLYDLVLKFHPYWELALLDKAMKVADALAVKVPESGSVQLSDRADHTTFEHLITAEILLTAVQYPGSTSERTSRALTRISRFIHGLHLERLDIADDPSHWLWAAFILGRASFPPSEDKIRAVIERIRTLRGNVPLWAGTTFRKFNKLAPFTQVPEVITAHIIINLARMRSALTTSDADDLIITPALVLCSNPVSDIWKGQLAGARKPLEDLYVHSLIWRAVLLSARLLSDESLTSAIVGRTGVPIPALWNSAVLSRDLSRPTPKENDTKRILELLSSLEQSIEEVGATAESVKATLEKARGNANRGSLELSIPLVPQLLRYKLELKL